VGAIFMADHGEIGGVKHICIVWGIMAVSASLELQRGRLAELLEGILQ